ncbi:MAG: HEAT repeat domain-containing protein [Deltaproteobacteria bacterium]|nr:HEAT repeat domain-containing protein [Deltaproteobacteria bacterium]
MDAVWCWTAAAVLAVSGCNQPTATPAAPDTSVGPAVTLRQQATGRDPDAPDEALRDAVRALQDRFACNAISGCPAHATLVGFGWQARPLLEQAFGRAGLQSSYRARAVQIVAEIRDPGAEPLLARLLDDRDPEVRAWAIVGLRDLDARSHRDRIAEATASDTLWLAAPRLAALWALYGWGEAAKGPAFQQLLTELARQQMAATALVVGAWLCARPDTPDCGAALPELARHPNFQVRRDALLGMARQPRRSYAAALVYLTNDQARSVRQTAMDTLAVLSRGHTATDHPGWQAWLAAQGGR